METTPVVYVVEILTRQGYADLAAQAANFEKVGDLRMDVWGEHTALVERAVELAGELEEHVHSVFVTAIEGGIDYWSELEEYRWSKPRGRRNLDPEGEVDTDSDLDGFYAVIGEPDGDEDEKGNTPVWRIDRHVIYRGLQAAAKPDTAAGLQELGMSANAREVARDLLAGRDADYDAGVADEIVQLALFGRVVYG